ncbi:sodium-dependent transporter bedraggled isoform X1 [Apis laboriosa]|uniref:sodium-dependent transporter bedraggled isoform X1 n=1 Tax=Apis laboriosa TaxID=183418 RepID=UPI001CC5DA03|nr:sodium-dependent transporter bedraggled isoform X1 [Apis laboriosa]XP_043803657.1 sodium-dependent transporter bedraggled isoform X1 [Apis laboriosa]
MTSNEDGDLIDLGNDNCVSRVSIQESLSDEQEHLLDVCPPKLEQALSLTRKQEQIQCINDNGDILVTLGHDQVVPIRKRIDVVSSDTIKRVRDITRNLEPVIRKTCSDINEEHQDTVDYGNVSNHKDEYYPIEKLEEETFEAQEINNAFNFLTEHDDNEDHAEAKCNHYDQLINSHRFMLLTCSTIKNKHLLNYHNNDCSKVLEYWKTDTNNLTFESSDKLSENISKNISHPFSYEFETNNMNIIKKCSEEEMFVQAKKRSFQHAHRKSWTEGTTFKIVTQDAFSRFDRSSSLREYNCSQPIFNGIHRQSSFILSCSIKQEIETNKEDQGDRYSDCSEVDWSWLEEIEYPRVTESLAVSVVDAVQENTKGRSASPTNETAKRRRNHEYRAIEAGCSAAMSVSGTVKSLVVDSSRWSTSDPLSDCNRHDQNEIIHCNTNNEIIDQEIHENSTIVNSWVRASMRRLRHLRLPEETERQRSIDSNNCRGTIASAPNSLPDIALIAPEILAAQTNGTSGTLVRPSSAPVRNTNNLNVVFQRSERQFRGSRSQRIRNREITSRQNSVLSSTTGSDTTVSGTTTYSSSFGGISTSPPSSTTSPQRIASRRICERQRDVDRNEDRGEDEDEDANPLGKWPHALSPALAYLSCTLGLFNISRFSILSIQFGANFIVQFLILSLILGIPLLTLHVCLGQRLAAGSVNMWKISPVFQGVGIALLIAQAFIGIYSVVGISWMFVYFRDSFITKQDKYRWAEPFSLYRDDKSIQNNSNLHKLYETVPDYFSGVVLQRHHLNESDPGVITLKFQLAFNLAVVWMIVFVSLSKGLKSYGKVVYVFTLVPVFGTLVLCTKLLGLTPPGSIHQLFPATVWTEFFINGKSWLAASIEVFLTWGLFGAAAMQIAAHNKHKHLLQRDTSLVIVLTIAVLLLAAFLANTCVQVLKHHGYIYIPSSFEKISLYMFMRPVNQPAPSGYSSTPERFMAHTSFIVGERVTRPGADFSIESGYQVLRLSTELVPATLALLGTEQVSPFWAILFYFILILFGIAQQLAIWHCVITGIMAINTKMMKLWETTVTFFSCACAYILGLPMATELGIHVVYYLDYTIGGTWWIIILYLVQVGAVFAVRGRPHSGEAVVAELFPPTGRCLRHWAGPLLSFTWNVILPVILMVLSITIFKNAGFRELYSYRRTVKEYWTIWAKQLGATIQLIPILTIPAVAIIQTCRYLNNGPPDIFDNNQVEVNINHCEQCNGRIQLLYRPSLESDDPRDTQTHIGNDINTSIHGNAIVHATAEIPFEDPPPKYTPPPSYTTATGARIAKMLRQSFRRSVRRIVNVLGESSTPRQRPALQPPPPDYATVLVEMNQNRQTQDVTIHITETGNENTNSNIRNNDTERHRPNTDRTMAISAIENSDVVGRSHSILETPRSCLISSSSSNLTAVDVANLLRSSIRRGTTRTQHSLHRSFCHDEPTVAASVENLVEAAAPIGEESLVLPKDVSLVSNEQINNNNDDKKTAEEMDYTVSVI